MEKPLVSVCISLFNRVNYLRQSLQSILKQDYEPLEILISDNCSNDDTEGFCLEIKKKDSRIRYIRQPCNIGLHANHNFLIENSQGEGSKIKILPNSQETEVKTIEKYLQVGKKAYAGESIGITTVDSVFLNRGDIVCAPNREPILTYTFKANIFWMARQDFHKSESLVLRCATQEVSCRIQSIEKCIDSSSLKIIQEDSQILRNLEVGEVIINTKEIIAVEKFNDIQELGRFVLVQDEDISAGGIITAIY